MKKHFLLLLFIFHIINIFSQENSRFYFLCEQESMIKLGHFNKRYIASGYTEYRIKQIIQTDSSKTLVMLVTNYDKFNKILSQDTIFIKKTNELLRIEPEFLISDQNIEINSFLSNHELIIPQELSAGMALNSAWIEVESSEKYYKFSEFSRTVDKFEKVKTLIGYFDACLISSKFEVQTNEQTENLFFSVEKWYAPGLGPVRINYYNNKRKLVKFSEVVEYKLPDMNL